jgi:hypothetical protein
VPTLATLLRQDEAAALAFVADGTAWDDTQNRSADLRLPVAMRQRVGSSCSRGRSQRRRRVEADH